MGATDHCFLPDATDQGLAAIAGLALCEGPLGGLGLDDYDLGCAGGGHERCDTNILR